jgi:GrpB-like predicted nucleotidyltransferase (UPF0157 family)/protein-L-isoaspartate O-methyltransferase
MLGCERHLVRLMPHQPAWAELFQREAERLSAALGDRVVRIEHVGSTAVPGLDAKPILDIVVAVREMSDAPVFGEALGPLGYIYKAENDRPDPLYFVKRLPDDRSTHHLFVTELGTECWFTTVAFRDYLREHREAREEYRRLKLDLVQRHATDRAAYQEGKGAFIERILSLARDGQRGARDIMGDWFEYYPESLWLQPDDTGSEEAQFIIGALYLKPGDRVLDAPCGAGRVAVHLARAGCQVSCLDLNPGFIARAKQRFDSEGLASDLRTMDLRNLEDCGRFDAVCNWGGSFGYWTDEENFDVLQRLAAALKPGGRLLVDQVNRQWLLRHFVCERRVGDRSVRTRWNAGAQRVESTWCVNGEDQPLAFSSIRLYTPTQFRRLLTSAELAWETAYGGKDGSRHTRSSRRMIVVGRKRV